MHKNYGEVDICLTKVIANPTLDINDVISDNDNISCYPNPSKGVFNIYNASGKNISITDILGKEVYSENIKSDNFPVNLKNNPKGIYFVNTGNKNSSVKIIIE